MSNSSQKKSKTRKHLADQFKPWSALQDVLLMQAIESHQDKWQVVSTAIPGQSPADCAHRYKELQSEGIQTLKDLQDHHKAQKANKPPAPKRTFIEKKPSLFQDVLPLPNPSKKSISNRKSLPILPKSVPGISSKSVPSKKSSQKKLCGNLLKVCFLDTSRSRQEESKFIHISF